MKPEKQKLSVLEKNRIRLWRSRVVISSMFPIATFFFTDIYGIIPIDVALMFLLVRLTYSISDPLMGLITHKFKFKSGRFRPFFLYLSVSIGISFFLTFTTPHFDYAGKLIYIQIY